MGKSACLAFGIAIALAVRPALAQQLGDTQTVAIPPASGQTQGACLFTDPLIGPQCLSWTYGSASASIDWQPPDGWMIVGTPSSNIGGEGDYVAEGMTVAPGGGNVISQRHLRRAYAIALKLANAGGKTDAAKALEAERTRLLAAYDANGAVLNTAEMVGGCNGDPITGAYGCSVTISGSANLIYVGPDDPFALLVSLIQRFRL
jgi:hypothetical protein